MAELDERLLEIIRNKEGAIFRGETVFSDQLEGIEKRLYKATREHLLKLNKTGGKFDFDEEDILTIAQLDKVLIDELQRSDYPGAVRKYLQDFDLVTDYNAELHERFNDIDPEELKNLVDPFKQQTVEDTLQGLTGSGVSTQFVEPVRQELFKNIVAGENATDIEATLRRMIEGDADTLGGLSRYVGQVTRDALNQYDGQINAKIADEFGLDAYQYVGSLIEDSRPQCVRWVGKNVLLKEELESEINWANSNGSGMIPGTTPQNFAIFRGGYNCRHSAIPFKMTSREKARLQREQAEAEEEDFEQEEEVVDKQIKELKKKVEDRKPSSESKTKFADNKFFTTIQGKEIEDVEEVFGFSNNLIEEITNQKGLNVTVRRPGECTKPGTKKFSAKMNAAKGTDVSEWTIGTVGTRSGGNCATNNTFLNIKMRKGDICEFKPVDLDTSPEKIAAFTEELKLEEIRHRGEVYLYDKSTGTPYFIKTRNRKTKEETWKYWTVGDRASYDLPGKTENVAPTVTHESGHAIQNNYDPNKTTFRSLFQQQGLSLSDAPTKYGESNASEFWAESFTTFVYDNEGFKARQPKVFEFVEAYLKRLGILDTIKLAK